MRALPHFDVNTTINVEERARPGNPKKEEFMPSKMLTKRINKAVQAVVETMESRTLMSSGTLDPTFGVGGEVNLTPNLTPGGQADAVAVQSNGDILVAGDQYPRSLGLEQAVLLRYLPNGDLDPSFGSDGKVLNADAQLTNAVAIEPNGDIVIAGRSNGDFFAARYTPSGHLDSSFGHNGEVKFDLGARDTVQALAITSDGKITLAGSTTAGSGGDFAVARLNANGSIDTSFGSAGKQFIDFNGKADLATDVKILNNQIYLAGYATTSSGNTDFALARLNLNGSLDKTYGTGGKTTTDFGHENAEILRMAIKADGTVVVAGYVSTNSNALQNSALAQYTPQGHLDTTFGSGGSVIRNFSVPAGNIEGQQLTGLALRADGSIVASGWVYDPTYNYEPTAHQFEWLAANFSSTGAVQNQNAVGFQYGGQNFSYNMVLDSSGHAVLVGQRQTTDFEIGVARLNTDLSLDTTFGVHETSFFPYAGSPNPQDAGSAPTTFGAVWGNPQGVAGGAIAAVVQPDGKTILAGGPIIRLNADGTLDPTFNAPPNLQPNPDASPILLLQPDSKLLVVTFQNLVRLNTDGSLDTSFGMNGTFTPSSGRFNAIAAGPNGTIYVAADTEYFTNTGPANFVLYRLTSDGALDTSFGNNGLSQIVTASPQQQLVTAIAVQSDGKVVLAGETQYTQQGGGLITRFNTDGTVDTTFGTNGFYTYESDASVSLLSIQGDNIILGGVIYPANQPPAAYVARLTSGGALDTSFGIGGRAVFSTTMEVFGGRGLFADSDGTIVVGVDVYSPTSSTGTAGGVYRLTPQGQVDSTFGSGGFVPIPLPAGAISVGVTSISPALDHQFIATLVVDPPGNLPAAYGAARLSLGGTTSATGSVTGTVYDDLNGDGIRQTGEPGLGGVTVYADLSNAGLFQAGDPVAVTDSNGNYILNAVPDGSVIILQTLPGGYRQSYPIGGAGDHVTVTPAGVTGALFADSIRLYIFGNVTLNGVGQGGVLVYADLNNNGVLDSGENNKTTNADGSFSFVSLTPGTYTFRVVAPAGTAVAGSSAVTVTLGSGGVDQNVSFALVTQTSQKLTGTVIGTPGSYNNDGNTIAKVFDGNLSTFFDAPTNAGNYVGLDLNSGRIINQILYAPRPGYASRLIGGRFQGSNSADFSSGVNDLYTIATAPPAGVLTSALVQNFKAYRYVRYLAPAGSFGNIAELQFYGYTPAGVVLEQPSETLVVNGTPSADNIQVQINSADSVNSETVVATVNGISQTFDLRDVLKIIVNAGAGDDTVNVGGYDEGPSDFLSHHGYETITINGGDGNDSLKVDVTDLQPNPGNSVLIDGGAGNDYLYVSGPTSATLIGGDGNDTFDSNGNPDGLNETVYGGAGNDTIWADSNTYYGLYDGGSGTNTIDFNHNASSYAPVDINLNVGFVNVHNVIIGNSGGTVVGTFGSDTITAPDAGSSDVSIQGGGGNDSISIDDANDANVTESGFGGSNNITVTNSFAATVIGGNGNDKINVRTTRTATVDGGPGIDTAYTDPGDIVTNVEILNPDQGHTKLTGTLIGTAGSYNNQGNTIGKVFDANLTNYFDAPTASGAWVGLDLGSAQVVTQVKYAPRVGFGSRMVGGQLQASDTADFSLGVVTLYTIATAPVSGAFTAQSLNNTTAFRYYRYIGPANSSCNIAELGFDG